MERTVTKPANEWNAHKPLVKQERGEKMDVLRILLPLIPYEVVSTVILILFLEFIFHSDLMYDYMSGFL